ncbi:hypothetical protein [Rhodococcus sp. BS-15]|uniref:hypothetical protein n=1 Tax=Rhodococcus sp. BS-15 TaxID=1304954 RepID=UPI000A9F054D|nr:hypothetical protein [Rhodococcus sp. BS-15]
MNAEISHADYHQRIRDTVHDPSSYECPLCGRRLADNEAVVNSTERSSAQPHRPSDENVPAAIGFHCNQETRRP